MKATFAERLYALLRSVDPSPATEMNDRLLARSAGRMLEENVELAMECGLAPAAIWRHVGDAIHNECIKAGRFPSELRSERGDRSALVAELADNALINDYVRLIAGISQEEIEVAAAAKVEKMEAARNAGTLNVIDGLMYTKRAAHGAN